MKRPPAVADFVVIVLVVLGCLFFWNFRTWRAANPDKSLLRFFNEK